MDIVWFKISDLRVRDHEPLYTANQTNNKLIHIFIWDCSWDDKSSNNILNMGKYKKKFLKESLDNLEKSLQKMNITLNIFFGNPEKILINLINKYKVNNLYTFQNIDQNQINIDNNIMQNTDINFTYFWGCTLHHLCDLPSNINNIPESFIEFKKELNNKIRSEFFPKSNDKSVKLKEAIDLKDIDIPETNNTYKGGEDELWKDIMHEFYHNKALLNYNENDFSNYVCDYEPWLTFGCISPKSLFFQIKMMEKKGKNKNSYLYFKKLLIRDYTIFTYLKNKINIQNINYKSSKNKMSFKKWIDGNTGIPIIDAIMNEIQMTGRTHNRCKLIAASFLINDLNIDWILGFEYFNRILTDIDNIQNLNIWNYINDAGLKNTQGLQNKSALEKIYYNPIKQVQKYDKEGSYIKQWIPELINTRIQDLYDPKDGIKDYYPPLVKVQFLISTNP